MNKAYHILNGDSLKEQFPPEIKGELIVARECLVDGDVQSNSLEELFKVRAQFINQFYGICTIEEYYAGTVSEFEKIKNIPANVNIHLWFEDDLFCQVNFWFVTYLLYHFAKSPKIFLVRPPVHTQYGFAGLTETELEHIFKNRVSLDSQAKIASLWEFYKNADTNSLLSTANELKGLYPFIPNAVQAHIARIPTVHSEGRPTETLKEIIAELKTDEFGPVFREFNKRESIYGFGDLQVKRIFDEIKKNDPS